MSRATFFLCCLIAIEAYTQDSVQPSVAVATVHHGDTPVVTYRAFLHNDYLVIESKHGQGWHTYAIDNEMRASDALKGKQSLGVEQGIKIVLPKSVKTEGPWLQTQPMDLSKPELRWYTFGFEGTAYFARKIKKSKKPFTVKISGQACNANTCCRVSIELVPVEGAAKKEKRRQLTDVLKSLSKVRSNKPNDS